MTPWPGAVKVAPMIKALVPVTVLALLATLGCEDPPAEAKAAEAKVAEAPAPVEVEEEPKADPEAEAKAAADAKAQAAVDADPLTECCRTLGKIGYMERSSAHMDAAKECGAALKAKKSMADALPAIKKSLADKAPPSECAE